MKARTEQAGLWPFASQVLARMLELGRGLPVLVITSALLSTCLEKFVIREELGTSELLGLCVCVGLVLTPLSYSWRRRGGAR